MYKSRNFKIEADIRLRMLEQQLKAKADELSAIKTKLAVTEEKQTKLNELEQQLKAQADKLAELKVKLTSIESAQSAVPELPGGMTPEEVIQEMYRMCGLGDDK